jgi:hypothetical protein
LPVHNIGELRPDTKPSAHHLLLGMVRRSPILSRCGLRILLWLLTLIVIVLGLRRVRTPITLVVMVAVAVPLLATHVIKLRVWVLKMRLLDRGGSIVIIHVVWGVLHWILSVVLLLLHV